MYLRGVSFDHHLLQGNIQRMRQEFILRIGMQRHRGALVHVCVRRQLCAENATVSGRGGGGGGGRLLGAVAERVRLPNTQHMAGPNTSQNTVRSQQHGREQDA